MPLGNPPLRIPGSALGACRIIELLLNENCAYQLIQADVKKIYKDAEHEEIQWPYCSTEQQQL